MKKVLATIVGFVCYLSSFAQTSITGTVIDKTSKRPVEFASVLLIQLPDSANTGTVTDKRGRFEIENVEPGTYLLRCSFIGFANVETVPFTINSNTPKYTVPAIELANEGKSLSNVTVIGRKSTLNTSIDRKVYNVEQDIMSRSGSVSDILKNIPSVEVDIDGNVSLRGSGDVLILINGKPSPLMGSSRAEVLQQLPANSIERIEVITNPSARYRPDGTSGIINIVLKKNIRNGFNGSAAGNIGNRDRYNGNITLNYRPKKFNLFGSYSIRHDSRRRYNTIDRTNTDSLTQIPENYYIRESYSVARPVGHIVNAGIDYTINEKNSMGVSGSYFRRKVTFRETMQNFYLDNNYMTTEHFNRILYGPDRENQTNGNFYFEHLFAKEDHEIRIEYTTSVEDEVDDDQFTNVYYIPGKPFSLDNILSKENTSERQLTIDYSNPLSEDSKLEMGYDGQYNKLDIDYYGEYYDERQLQFVKDLEISNRFIYKENIHALYSTYQRDFEKFGFSAGMRAEGVDGRGHLMAAKVDSFITNRYFKIYPTIHLSYRLHEQSELQLNYSKRVNRPDGDELNPFPEYQDPRNLYAGNPNLKPEIIHSMEFGYKWSNNNFSFVPSLYYRYKLNGFTTVIVPLNDTTFLTTEQNLSKDQSAGLELIFSARNGKWLSLNFSSNIFYNRIDATNLGYTQNRSVVSMSSTFNSNFNLTKTTMLQVSANYRSARLTPQGKNYPNVVFNAGLRQDLFRNKLSVTFTASDMFATLRQKTFIDTPLFKQLTTGRRDSRVIYLGISYRFGVIQKSKEKSLDFDDGLQ